jgi:hypothetical protein
VNLSSAIIILLPLTYKLSQTLGNLFALFFLKLSSDFRYFLLTAAAAVGIAFPVGTAEARLIAVLFAVYK